MASLPADVFTKNHGPKMLATNCACALHRPVPSGSRSCLDVPDDLRHAYFGVIAQHVDMWASNAFLDSFLHASSETSPRYGQFRYTLRDFG